MTRNGRDIKDVPVKHGIAAGIAYSQRFLEWEAATAAGLDVYKWERGEYSRAFRETVIAWFNLHSLVKAHQDDAAIDDMDRKK